MLNDVLRYLKDHGPGILNDEARCFGFLLWCRFASLFEQWVTWETEDGVSLTLPLRVHPTVSLFHHRAIKMVGSLPWDSIVDKTKDDVLRIRISAMESFSTVESFSAETVDLLKAATFGGGQSYYGLIHAQHSAFFEATQNIVME